MGRRRVVSVRKRKWGKGHKWVVRWLDSCGTERKEAYDAKCDADSAAAAKRRDVELFGWDQERALSPEQRRMFWQNEERLAEFGVSQSEAISMAIRQLQRPRKSLADVIEVFQKDLLRRNLAKDTVDGYLWKLKPLEAGLGGRDISEIQDSDLLELLHQHYSDPRTMQTMKKHWTGPFEYAVREGWLTTNPCSQLSRKLPKLVKTEIEYLACPDVKALMGAIGERQEDDLPSKAILALCLFCGLRRGELVRLPRRNVNLERRTILIEAVGSKKGVRRPLGEHLLPGCLWPWLESCPAFWVSDKPICQIGQWQRRLEWAREDAGITHWPNNALRHTAITYMVDAAIQGLHGFTLAQIRRIVGHRTETQINDYEGVVPDKNWTAQYFDLRPSA